MNAILNLFHVALIVLLSTSAYGEIYRGIQPLSTMKDLRALFPGAQFTFVKTAWATEGESLYQVTGPGLPGKMMIKFNDSSVFFRKYIEERPEEEVTETFRNLAVSSDKTLGVDWVRYVPDSQIPVDRLISKYGPPEESGFSEDDFSPYKNWKSKGVYAVLSDNGKDVLFIDYSFTKKETCVAFKQRHEFTPDYCKDKPEEKPKLQKKSAQ